MATSDHATLVCPHCVEPITRFDHFCPHGGGPVTAHASTDPLGQVFASGRAYQNAAKSTRRLVVIGMWLILGPQLPLLIYGPFLTLSNLFRPGRSDSYGDGSVLTPISDGLAVECLKAGLVIGMLVLCGAILTKVTSRYLKARGKHDA